MFRTNRLSSRTFGFRALAPRAFPALLGPRCAVAVARPAFIDRPHHVSRSASPPRALPETGVVQREHPDRALLRHVGRAAAVTKERQTAPENRRKARRA